MAKLDVLAGATSVSLAIFIQDSSSTVGAGLTGLAFNTASLTCYAVVPGSSAAAITLATLAAANSAWSSGGFKEIDASNMPGWYRFDVPNTNISTGRSVGIHFKGATNMAPLPLEISLVAVNNQSTGFGLVDVSANVVKLLGTAWLTPGTAGTPDVNTKLWNALATVELPLVPLTAGRKLDVTAANKVNGVVLVDTLTTYTGNTPQTGDAYARLGAPAGASVSADVAAVKVDTAAIKAKTDNLPSDPADQSLIIAATDAIIAAIAALNNLSAAGVLTQVNSALDTALADSIPADGALPTLRQANYMQLQFMLERAVAGTTVTVKKVDGSTTLFTLTLNDGTTPVSITRAT